MHCNKSFGQTEFKLTFGRDTLISFLECDNLGNMYLVSAKNDILKIDSTGTVKLKIKYNQWGEVNRIDLRDPLQPTLFYPSQNRIVTTDQYLQVINSLDVNGLGIEQYTQGCLSNDGNYWIYCPEELKLKKVNLQGAIMATTNPFSQLNIPARLSIDYIKETSRNVIVLHKGKGITLFDYFGGFIRFVPLEGIETVSIYQDKLFLTYSNQRCELFAPQLNKFIDVTLQIEKLNRFGKVVNGIKIFNEFILFNTKHEVQKVKFNGFTQ